jgi:hypothetical protein
VASMRRNPGPMDKIYQSDQHGHLPEVQEEGLA